MKAAISQAEFAFSGGHNLEVQRIDSVDRYRDQVAGSSSAILITGLLGLIASAVGIVNIGLSSLQQRSIELSLRRAMGAKKWHIAWIMFLESQIVAVTAGLLAIPISYAMHPLVLESFGAPPGIAAPGFPIEFALGSLLSGMAASFIGSIVPALRAMRVPIIGIVRE